MNSSIKFAGWFFLTASLHAAGIVFWLIAEFGRGLAGKGGSGTNMMLVLWAPPMAYLRDFAGRSANDVHLFLLGVIWCVVVGVAWAFCLSWSFPDRASFKKKAAGMPWEGHPGWHPPEKRKTNPVEYVLLVSFPFALTGILMTVVDRKISTDLLFLLWGLALAVFGVVHSWLKVGRKMEKMALSEWIRLFLGCVVELIGAAIGMVVILMPLFLI